MKHKILFVHGFGVKKDARGMFSEMRDSFERDTNIACTLVDLNTVENGSNDIYLNPLSKQEEILKQVYGELASDDSTIDLICHSQGCVVGSMAKLPNIRQVFLLAPPTDNDVEKTIHSFLERDGTKIDLMGESILMRKDGSRTFVPKEYWDEREGLDYITEYTALSKRDKVTVILGKQDEVVSNEKIAESLPDATVIIIDGNHNFEGPSRQELIEVIKNNL